MNYSQNAWASNCAASFARGQRGMATMLIILLIGVGTVAISLGSMYMIRSTQERQVAAHAQVNAQSGAWAAVEAMRQYLLTLNAAQVAALPVNKTWTLSGYTGFTQTARFNSVTQVTVDGKTAYRVNMRISATATAAQSSSVLEVVYQTIPAVAGVTAPNTSVIHYHGDLNLTGGIDILKDAGETKPYEINVIGNVTIGQTKLTGVDVVRSTASVNINGADSFIREVHANGDVRVGGATLPQKIQATRHICLNWPNRTGYPSGQSTDSVDMRANGSIYMQDASGKHQNVFALAGRGGYSYISSGAVEHCNSNISGAFDSYGTGAVAAAETANGGGVWMDSSAEPIVVRSGMDIIAKTGSVGEFHAQRNIHFLSSKTLDRYVRYGGDLFIDSEKFESYEKLNSSIKYIYKDIFGENTSSPKRQHQQNYSFELTPARRVDLQTETFDVNDLKDYANYIFSADAAGNARVVVRRVKNSSGASMDYEGDDGKGYYLNTIWLCRSNNAVTPTNDVATTNCPIKISSLPIDKNHRIKFDKGTWTLGNQSDFTIAPGLAFFEGDLVIQTGTFYNTFLATGNITTINGQTVVYAPNFAGYDGKQNGITYAPDGICVNKAVPNLIPTQFCNGTAFNFSAIQGGVGNYAFMAGTCAGATPCTKANYRGGDVATNSSSDIFGAIKAGNKFTTAGNSTVHGYISALAQRVQTANHELTAKTTIDLRKLPPGFDPSGGPKNPGGSTPGTSAEVSVLWSRYL